MVLTDLQEGEQVRITHTNCKNGLVQRRLLDLGIMEGSLVRIKRILPLGGPIAIEAKGQLIGIRRGDAKLIQVECV
ncbi:ferrous iron transport protein A [Brevibacillus ruminantium]|uniref:Ferrous iron transport protein A n=1 Tax=Brevibacillus ruminantium TaxID=2950604 RepID=A0ABY4WGA0_9BACL|nr:FeoA family protein [Brevibacillus ruminantium]USG64354.1 ferrous iron transport protein A [Brevibacillus ruminantium]